MDEGYTSLPSSHLLGSVPAAIPEEKKASPSEGASSHANLQIFPPTNGGYQPPGSPSDGDEHTSNWKGVFSISSYQPFFNVDTDVVVDRIMSSVYPMNNFYRKIEGNPDMYGPVWICATLVFMISALGNFGTYLMHRRSESNTDWNYDVNYINWAACAIYGYTIAVPAAYYFLLQYMGCNSSLVRLWCMWGYSLFIFMPTSLLLVIPSEILRWIFIVLAGCASSWFIALNLRELTGHNGDLMVLVVSAIILQFALAVFIKAYFFA